MAKNAPIPTTPTGNMFFLSSTAVTGPTTPPNTSVAAWAGGMGSVVSPLTGGSYKQPPPTQVPLPSMLIAQSTANKSYWNVTHGLPNPQRVVGMWLYELHDSISGFVHYAWVSDTGSVIEHHVPNNYPAPNQSNLHACQAAGLSQRPGARAVDVGGNWMGESRSGSAGIAGCGDKIIIQLYDRVSGPEESDSPAGYLLVNESFVNDLIKAWVLYKERANRNDPF